VVPRLYGRQANWLRVVGLTRLRAASSHCNRAVDKLIVFVCVTRAPTYPARLLVSLSENQSSRIVIHLSCLTTRLYGQAARAISTGQLNASRRFHTLPINVVVFDGPLGSLKLRGDLILKEASRLDAFSGYPVRT
jgi:hypothetical protein